MELKNIIPSVMLLALVSVDLKCPKRRDDPEVPVREMTQAEINAAAQARKNALAAYAQADAQRLSEMTDAQRASEDSAVASVLKDSEATVLRREADRNVFDQERYEAHARRLRSDSQTLVSDQTAILSQKSAAEAEKARLAPEYNRQLQQYQQALDEHKKLKPKDFIGKMGNWFGDRFGTEGSRQRSEAGINLKAAEQQFNEVRSSYDRVDYSAEQLAQQERMVRSKIDNKTKIAVQQEEQAAKLQANAQVKRTKAAQAAAKSKVFEQPRPGRRVSFADQKEKALEEVQLYPVDRPVRPVVLVYGPETSEGRPKPGTAAYEKVAFKGAPEVSEQEKAKIPKQQYTGAKALRSALKAPGMPSAMPLPDVPKPARGGSVRMVRVAPAS